MINHLNEDEHNKHVKAKVFEGISDFHKRVKKDLLLMMCYYS